MGSMIFAIGNDGYCSMRSMLNRNFSNFNNKKTLNSSAISSVKQDTSVKSSKDFGNEIKKESEEVKVKEENSTTKGVKEANVEDNKLKEVVTKKSEQSTPLTKAIAQEKQNKKGDVSELKALDLSPILDNLKLEDVDSDSESEDEDIVLSQLQKITPVVSEKIQKNLKKQNEISELKKKQKELKKQIVKEKEEKDKIAKEQLEKYNQEVIWTGLKGVFEGKSADYKINLVGPKKKYYSLDAELGNITLLLSQSDKFVIGEFLENCYSNKGTQKENIAAINSYINYVLKGHRFAYNEKFVVEITSIDCEVSDIAE